MESLGVIETKGLVSAIKAADAACKAASVEIIGYRKIGSGLVSVCFQGEISAVRTAVDYGINVIADSQLLVGSLVIARPEPSVVTKLLTGKSHKVKLEENTKPAEKTLKLKIEKQQETNTENQSVVEEKSTVNVVAVKPSSTDKEQKNLLNKGKKS